MKKLTLNDIQIEIFAEVDDMPIEGNAIDSGDADFDTKVCNDIRRQLDNGNVWAWAGIEVKGTYKGLTASDYLGGCSYEDEAEFKKDGYYSDMCESVLDALNKMVADIVNSVTKCPHTLANEQIIANYPIQDEQWPSRRWNEDKTEYQDLSGCDC